MHRPHWVHSWASVPQLAGPGDLPPPFAQDHLLLADTTLRQTIRASVGGQRMRLSLSNAFGSADLPITAVTVAKPDGGQAGVSATVPGTTREVTFHGRTALTLPAGAHVVSDPVDCAVAPRANLTVTMYLAAGLACTDITGHPGSRTTSYLATGNHTREADLPGAVAVEHWYVLSGLELSGLEARCGPGRAAAIVGDSLTDGRGSTTNGNDRWPDRLLHRLHGCGETAGVAVVNQAAGGNRVLRDGVGPSALSRVERDVLTLSGLAWLVVFEGANDIGTADATVMAQKQVTDELIGAYEHIVRSAHAKGIRVYGATITPFRGNTDYDDPAGLREASRRAVNHWIRTSDRFDATIDFDRAVRDPADTARLLPAFDVGDHLHLNPMGYQALADAVPVDLFRHRGPTRPRHHRKR